MHRRLGAFALAVLSKGSDRCGEKSALQRFEPTTRVPELNQPPFQVALLATADGNAPAKNRSPPAMETFLKNKDSSNAARSPSMLQKL